MSVPPTWPRTLNYFGTPLVIERHFGLRRQRDPLGEGYPCTWRTLLIKVAAEVVVSTRRDRQSLMP